MTPSQRGALHTMLHAILACKATITPEIQLRAEGLSQRLRDDATANLDPFRAMMREAGLPV